MNYKHIIIIKAENSRATDVIINMLNKHTDFGEWNCTIRTGPWDDQDEWWFELDNTVSFTTYEIISIIDALADYLQFEPWHIALNNVGDYDV